jgi:3-oxoadipate enol-lactonase
MVDVAHVVVPDGTRIHYETFGRADGEPVLLVQGLGADRRAWLRQRRAIGRHHRGIVFDNRGVGHSDIPSGPYDLHVMAGDALAVLDAVGVHSAHLVGVSMGGIMSQVLAVLHPERVRSLTLVATACHHHAWRRELLAEWADLADRRGMRAVVDAAAEWLIGPRARVRFWPVISLLGPLAVQVEPRAFRAQVDAILGFDDTSRGDLERVKAPALVVVGSQDVLTPVGDSELLHELIPDSRLVIVSGAAHGITIEQAGPFNHHVTGFLQEVADLT